MQTVDLSIIQKVKNELQVDSDIESTDLFDLLFDYRNTQHPDKYIVEEQKKKAEEKFKHLNNLLEQLSKHIELEKQTRKPSELIPFQKNYEVAKFKQTVVWKEDELKRLQDELNSKNYRIKALEETLDEKLKKEQEELIKQLIDSYKPQKSTYVYGGVSLVLVFIYSILKKSESIFSLIKEYSPFDPLTLRSVFFIILVFIMGLLLKKYFETAFIKTISEKILNPKLVRRFYLKIPEVEEKKSQYFDEYLVYDFIEDQFRSKNIVVGYIQSKIFPVFNEISLNYLKNIFIYNLLNKKLIRIDSAEKLDRKFKVMNNYYPF